MVTGVQRGRPMGSASRQPAGRRLTGTLRETHMNSTALLVIDIQRGAFDGQRCSPIDRPDLLIEHAASLISAARAGSAPVVFIQHCDGADQVFEEGTAHWELHERLTPRDGDVVMKKYESSA